MRTQVPFLNFQPLSLKYFSHPPDFPNTGFPTPPPLVVRHFPSKGRHTPFPEPKWEGVWRKGPGEGGSDPARSDPSPPPSSPPPPPPRDQASSHLHTDLHGPKALWSFRRRDFPRRPTGQQIYKPADRRWGVGEGDRGKGVLGGRSSTRDTSALILEPFFPRSLCTSHSLPSPTARSPPILSTKMGMRRGTAVFRKYARRGYRPLPAGTWIRGAFGLLPAPSPSKKSPRSYRPATPVATFLLPSCACRVIWGAGTQTEATSSTSALGSSGHVTTASPVSSGPQFPLPQAVQQAPACPVPPPITRGLVTLFLCNNTRSQK